MKEFVDKGKFLPAVMCTGKKNTKLEKVGSKKDNSQYILD
jgi:hypothetical protein